MVTLTVVLVSNANAVTPSPAMIEQLKQLPKSEQLRLMKQYGIDPTTISQPDQPLVMPTIVNERKNAEQQQIAGQAREAFAPVVKAVETDTAPAKAVSLKPFGYDMFAGEPTTFAPVSDVPVPSDYMMGPGDVVNVNIYGKNNQKYSLTVARDGNILLPELGPVSVMGLTFKELKNALTQKIQEHAMSVETSISLGELRSIRIIIAGESYKPGTYTVSALSTMTQALFVSGGINDIGSLRDIKLNRGGQLIGSFDLYELLTKGYAENDFRLQSGDVIFIPPVGASVAIKGEVRRPAIYEMKSGENITDLIRLAAGLKANSYPKASLLETFDKNHLPRLLRVDLTKQSERQLKLKDGDVLTVKSTTNRVQQQVSLAGEVNRPGVYQWRQGMRVSDVIESLWTDLNDDADLTYALLARKINMQGDIKVLQFSLQKLFESPEAKFDFVLEPQDKLVILSKNNKAQRDVLLKPIIEQLKRQVDHQGSTAVASITGEVHFPGEYPIAENIHLNDLIIAAGGLKDSAYLQQAEITSITIDPVEGASVSHQPLNLQQLLNGDDSENKLVASKDHLQILQIPLWQEEIKITLHGEVKFPGTYSVRRGESLHSVIKRAGGYTEQAFLEGAVFTRESVRLRELQQIEKLADRLRLDIAARGLTSQKSSVPFSEASLMLKELENLKAVGRMVVELSPLGIHGLSVEAGDRLFIPAQQQTITVVGEVQHTSTHIFKEHYEMNGYLKLAGGTKQRADKDRIYVIRANGSVAVPEELSWLSNDAIIQPGDTIVVPLDTEYTDNLSLWTQVSSIIYNTAVAFAAINGI